MTLETLARLLGLNLGYLVVGWALLWAGGAGRTWRQLLRLGGLGYLAAVALSGIVWVELLIVGVPFRWLTVVATPLLILVVALVAGHLRGRKPPHGHLTRGVDVAVVSVVGVAAVGVFLEALFRAARLQSLQAYDAWAFWLPKAKMIHTGGGLDPELLGRLPWPGYPLLGPVLDAAAFTAMGTEDVVTLHVQFWCFTVGFVWAVAGVLTPRVTAWLLWPFLVLALVVPRMGERFLMPQADYLLDFSCVVAALALALWLDSEDRRWLVVALLFLSAAVLTKREGLMLAFCILAATFLASSDRWRSAWPRLVAIGAATALVAVPWRLWYRSNALAGEGPGGGLLSLDGREGRFGPAVRLAVDVLFDAARWSLLPALLVGAVVVALLAKHWRLGGYVAALVVLVTAGGIWASWAFTDLPITDDEAANPIVRYTAATILLAGVFAPLLLGRVWQGAARQESS